MNQPIDPKSLYPISEGFFDSEPRCMHVHAAEILLPFHANHWQVCAHKYFFLVIPYEVFYMTYV